MKRGYDSIVQKRKIFYEWRIKKFTSYIDSPKNKDSLKSTQFSSGANINDLWCLTLKFNNNDESVENKEWISIIIQSLSDRENIVADYLLYIVLNDESKQKYENKTHYWRKKNDVEQKVQFIEKNQVKDFLKEDVLILGIEMTVHDCLSNSNDASVIPKKKIKIQTQLLIDLKKLYESKKGSDVIMNVQGKDFNAHKSILLARSDLFSAMFDKNTTEDNKHEISDIKSEVFEKLLEYCYTDEVSDIDDVNEDLLEAARKYQLESLEKMCEISLIETVKIDNTVKRLIFAEDYKLTKLLDFMINYIINHSAKVMETPDYKIIEQKPSLSSMLFSKAMKIYQQSPPKIIHYS